MRHWASSTLVLLGSRGPCLLNWLGVVWSHMNALIIGKWRHVWRMCSPWCRHGHGWRGTCVSGLFSCQEKLQSITEELHEHRGNLHISQSQLLRKLFSFNKSAVVRWGWDWKSVLEAFRLVRVAWIIHNATACHYYITFVQQLTIHLFNQYK